MNAGEGNRLNYSQKLRRMADRRQGLYARDGTFNFVEAALSTNLRKSERYEALPEPEAVRYAIGAMQAVDSAYTADSFAEGNRVKDRLAEGLLAAKIPATFDFQGSVPLDVHVRGNSDVDLLVLHDAFVTYDPEAKIAFPSAYTGGPYGKSAIDELHALRTECAAILTRRYYGAKVDTEPSKAITLSGGSLKRVVDVVPSHWHNTVAWHQTYNKRHRDIHVLDRKANQRVRNKPFMHIGLIEDRCKAVQGALRKVIRLLKNLRYDADKTIDLSSYDIAALAWHMSEQELTVPYSVDLLLVERARLHVKYVVDNQSYREKLNVPDGSRKIFDKDDKLAAVTALYRELERLSEDIAKELNPLAGLLGTSRSTVLAKSIYL
jgi:hypothetical protein